MGKGLNEVVVVQVFIYVEGIEVFGVEVGEQYIYYNDDVDFIVVSIVGIWVFLVFDVLLYILVIEVKFIDGVIGIVLLVVVGNNFFQSCFFFIGFFFIIFLFLG